MANIADFLLMSAIAVDNATVNSDSVRFDLADQAGTAVVFLISSAAGGLSVSQQCSRDDVNWFDPVDSDGNALGEVVTAQGTTTGSWVSYSPVMSPYIRFKAVEDGTLATNVTIRLLFQEGRT